LAIFSLVTSHRDRQRAKASEVPTSRRPSNAGIPAAFCCHVQPTRCSMKCHANHSSERKDNGGSTRKPSYWRRGGCRNQTSCGPMLGSLCKATKHG
ncbi:unnamed protein product, partial [Musa acuminata var. zebrina]